MIHVALVSAYPTEAEARRAIAEGLHTVALGEFRGTPYLGVWRLPAPHEASAHVFSRIEPKRLMRDGWTREDAR